MQNLVYSNLIFLRGEKKNYICTFFLPTQIKLFEWVAFIYRERSLCILLKREEKRNSKKKKNQAIWQPQVMRANKALRGVWPTRNLIWELRVCYNKRKHITYSHLKKIINGNRDRICPLQVLQNLVHWISNRLDKFWKANI